MSEEGHNEPEQRSQKRFIMRAKYYPPGGPKIVRQELERLGFQWVPPSTPYGMQKKL